MIFYCTMNSSNCDSLMAPYNVKVCRICFTSQANLCQIRLNNTLLKAYVTLTGLLMEKEDNVPPYLCIECSHQLLDCDRFRARSVQAHAELLEIVKKYNCITFESVQSLHLDPFYNNRQSPLRTELTNPTNQYDINIDIIKKENIHTDQQEDTQHLTVSDIKAEADDVMNLRILNQQTANGATVYVPILNEYAAVDSFKTEDMINAMEHVHAFGGGNYSSDDNVSIGGVAQKVKMCQKGVSDGYTRMKFNTVQKPRAEGLQNSLSGVIYPYQTTSNGTTKTYNCKMCDYKTIYKKRLACHLRVHSGLKPFSCPVCNKSFRRKSHLESHLRTHSGERSYTCEVCYINFSEKSSLQRHFKKHSGVKPHSCHLCSKAFSRRYLLLAHLQIHSGQKAYPCQLCTKSFTRNYDLQRHLREHSGVKPFSCHMCDKVFMRKGSLKEHIKNHSGEKPFSCDTCKKSFARKNDLQRHLREHFGDKPYSCEVCQRVFSRQNSLKIHLKKHTIERPHPCNVCNRTFSREGYLKKHLRVHSDVKPFACDYCSKAFNRADLLQIHLREHTGEKPFSCEVCQKAFSRKHSLKVHLKKHSAEKPYSCNICNKSFTRNDYLQRHLKTHIDRDINELKESHGETLIL